MMMLLSYNLGYADLASKWIVDIYVSYFQNYIQSTLTGLCDENLLPVIVSSTKLLVDGVRLVPSGASGTVYCSDTGVIVERCTKPSEWNLRFQGADYSSVVIGDMTSLHKCTGEWKNANYNPNVYHATYGYAGPNSTQKSFFSFRIESINEADENNFVNVVKCVQSHEEYRHGTIFATDNLSTVFFNHTHLRTKKILGELMSRDDLLEYSILLQG
jgi:hypothetical protein